MLLDTVKCTAPYDMALQYKQNSLDVFFSTSLIALFHVERYSMTLNVGGA